MHVVADVGGIPGKDCNGFCKYCYFRKVKEIKVFGCAHCLPNKVGCERCSKGVADSQSEFKSPFEVFSNVQNTIMMNMGMGEVIADISGGGDISCYPHLESLTAQFNQFSIKSHLGYSCGKGISDREIASRLINNGVEEATFTVFSTDPKLRQQWVRDKHPQEALNACRIFCENIKLTGASVIIPGVNDGDVLRQTCDDLESWGAKGFILMRFANTFNEGLILGNEPILKDHESQPVEEFGQLVKDLNNEYNFRITGTPLCDPETGGPFAIAKDENQIFLQFIKPVTGEATIITSKIAAPYILNFIVLLVVVCVNVVGVVMDLGCVITIDVFDSLVLSEIKDAVILPGRSFVHQLDAERILSADGIERIVGRGPDTLTVDGELSIDLTDENVIERELEDFNDLVDAINFFGMRRL